MSITTHTVWRGNEKPANSKNMQQSFSPEAVTESNPEHLFLQKIQSQAARQAHAFLTWTPTKLDWQESRGPGIEVLEEI